MMVLSYTGFLRYSEVSDLKASDIKWKKTHIELFIEKSKTDIYRDGHWLLISKLNSPICPLRILKRYLVRTDTHKNSNKFLFRGMNFFKNSKTHKLRKKNKPLSYSAARSNMLDMVTKIGLKRKTLVYIVCDLAVPQQRPTKESLTDYSNAMAGGRAKKPKTAILKTSFPIFFQFP